MYKAGKRQEGSECHQALRQQVATVYDLCERYKLLGAFSEELGELALVPGGMGVFVVRLEGEEIFSKKAAGRYPEPKELKEAIAARIAPDRHFGHKR